ncbi:gephyrin-like molybdotransferase Glp [Actinomyces sp. ZJ308]|uniref:molybdopterin molybdotransferase MoeA n=1 Tax=Actinomyces sp. ZJ308 TaxID=2708342 RepID=UPI00142404C1|nr:gephyrin-like molybdotransferase Glp [Actinomyces sp. ZJ308]
MAQLIPLEDYVAQVLESLVPLKGERVALAEAHGRVLAEDVAAAVPVPPWTNSAMDGYAVRAAQTSGASPQAPVVLPVAGDVPAGAAPAPLVPGSAQRIMTGAMLPEGADAVVKVEDTDQAAGPHPLPGRVEIRVEVGPGTNVRGAGEDVRAGDPVMAAGTRLSATGLSALASVGLGSVRVAPRVRVAVVSTGAELRDAGQELVPGTIPDSNGLLLAGLVAEHGALCTGVDRSVDTAEDLAAVLRRAADGADLIVTSGGVSAGAFDPLTMLAQVRPGEDAPVSLDFVKVAMQPGKPQGHGWVRADDGRRVPIICLPGNPVSVLVSFTTIVAPALARLAGQDAGGSSGWNAGMPQGRPRPAARAAVAWRTPPGRRQHVPVRFTSPPDHPTAAGDGSGGPSGNDAKTGEGLPWVTPTHRLGSGSHLVASLPAAQALAVVGAEVEAVDVGDELTLIPLSGSVPPVRADAL